MIEEVIFHLLRIPCHLLGSTIMEPVSSDLLNHLFEITKAKLWDDFLKTDLMVESEAERLWRKYACLPVNTGECLPIGSLPPHASGGSVT